MKQPLLILVAILGFTFAEAQSGLQFSQVKFLPLTFSAVGSQVLGTVPAGKVWKLEQAVADVTDNTLNYYNFQFNGGAARYPIPVNYTGSNTFYMSNNVAYWWPAGTQINVYSGAGIGSVYFSIIEFSVVP